MIKVIIADDHQIVLDGLNSILNKEPDIEVVALVNNGQSVLDFVRASAVDVAVIDIEMPELNGIELTKILIEENLGVKVIVLTTYKTPRYVSEVFATGAAGYIPKNNGQEELVKAIRSVHKGETYLGEGILPLLMENFHAPKSSKQVSLAAIKLTKREKEVLKYIMDGKTVKRVAEELFISVTTVESHKQNIFVKAGVANVKELIAFAYKNDLLKDE